MIVKTIEARQNYKPYPISIHAPTVADLNEDVIAEPERDEVKDLMRGLVKKMEARNG